MCDLNESCARIMDFLILWKKKKKSFCDLISVDFLIWKKKKKKKKKTNGDVNCVLGSHGFQFFSWKVFLMWSKAIIRFKLWPGHQLCKKKKCVFVSRLVYHNYLPISFKRTLKIRLLWNILSNLLRSLGKIELMYEHYLPCHDRWMFFFYMCNSWKCIDYEYDFETRICSLCRKYLFLALFWVL